jgi:glycosyltransferase involved in cell wall biosynthesis
MTAPDIRDRSVLVTHPRRQHSHELARGLHEAGLLGAYWAGLAPPRALDESGAEATGGLAARLHELQRPRDVFPTADLALFAVAPAVGYVVRRFARPSTVVRAASWAEATFDRWAARRLSRMISPPAMVVCYEGAGLRTFETARALGCVTVLDAASVHHTVQDAELGAAFGANTRALAARKDAEVALADHVFTLSRFARDTYLEAGVPAEKLTVLGLGADVARFTPRTEPRSGPCHFVFAGTASRVKGADVLLEAAALLRARGVVFRLTHAGGMDQDIESGRQLMARTGRLSTDALASLFRTADCLVLPSRFDSFGIVVVEAMAAGLPVIVSDHVGAADLVDHGRTGWVVPSGSAEALAGQMARCAADVESVSVAGSAARLTAEQHDWARYRRRAADVVAALLARRSASKRGAD